MLILYESEAYWEGEACQYHFSVFMLGWSSQVCTSSSASFDGLYFLEVFFKCICLFPHNRVLLFLISVVSIVISSFLTVFNYFHFFHKIIQNLFILLYLTRIFQFCYLYSRVFVVIIVHWIKFNEMPELTMWFLLVSPDILLLFF